MKRYKYNCFKKLFTLFSLTLLSSLLYGEPETARTKAPLSSDIFSSSLSSKPEVSAPVVDGDDSDAVWNSVEELSITLGRDKDKVTTVTIKSCRVGGRLFFLIQCPLKKLVKMHRVWHWDDQKKIYVPGTEEETSLSLFFYKDLNSKSDADVWVWRAVRTNPTGFADDMLLKDSLYSMDQGRSSWFSRFFGEFAGSDLPRFYQRTPDGSAADVKAKGRLKNGVLIVEFSRNMDTGHSDDIPLDNQFLMKLIFQPGSN